MFPHQAPVVKLEIKSKIPRCRWCRDLDHNIKSCYYYHTNGEGIIQDDDPSRKFEYSVGYHFPNKPSDEYTSHEAILQRPPIREFVCRSKYTMGTQARDYLMDRKSDPIDDAQALFFQTKSKKVTTTKTTRKRKRVTGTKPSLEQRLIKLELLYRNDVQGCFANSFTKGIVTAVELRSEIFRLTPVAQIEWKIEKE